MKKIMSIALFSDPRNQGGIETFNRNMKEFYPDNLKILVNSNNKKKIYNVSGIIEQKKESKIFKFINKIFFNKLREKKIKNIINLEKPDILIFSLFYEFNIFKKFKQTKILVQHFSLEKLKKETKNKILKKYLDYYVVLSPYEKEKFKKEFGLLEENLRVIRHTSNIELLGEIKKTKNKQLVMITRIDNTSKRFDLAIKAMKKLSEFTLNIYGDFHTEKDKIYLQNLLEEEKISNVFFRGSTTKVQEKLDESGIFIMTSDGEGYPISTIEAMRRGLPIILRNTFDSAQDIVIDNGVLLEKEWNEDRFVEAVRKVYDNYEYYSENSKKLGERHSPEVIKKEWDKLFKEIEIGKRN